MTMPAKKKSDQRVKSALEIALERAEQQTAQAPPPPSEAQKRKLTDIEKRYQARIAEKKIVLTQQMVAAAREGNIDEAQNVKAELTSEIARLQQKMEEEKAKVRAGG
jgi:hypothetical protein